MPKLWTKSKGVAIQQASIEAVANMLFSNECPNEKDPASRSRVYKLHRLSL